MPAGLAAAGSLLMAVATVLGAWLCAAPDGMRRGWVRRPVRC